MRVSVTGVMRWSQRLVHLAARVALGAMVLALALAGWLISPSAARAARLDSNPPVTIDIQNPQPRGDVAQGPVGANIYAQGATQPGDQLIIGFAPQNTSCQTGFQPINDAQPTIDPTGQFTVAFKWPDAANAVNTQYYLCAQDTTSNTIGQSQEVYQVLSADAPAISVQQVDNPTAPTAVPGTPTPAPTAPAPAGKVYSGGYLQIQGANFVPGGQNISFFLTPGAFTPGDYVPGNALNVVSGNTRTANDGSFQVIVQLPAGEIGSLTVSAVSQDGTGALLPTLVASQHLSIITPPATPTPQPTVSPTVQATASVGNGNGGQRPAGPLKITALIGLGTLSVILFIVGVSFLISASSMPKPEI